MLLLTLRCALTEDGSGIGVQISKLGKSLLVDVSNNDALFNVRVAESKGILL